MPFLVGPALGTAVLAIPIFLLLQGSYAAVLVAHVCVGGQQRKNVRDASVTAVVGIGRDGNGFGLEVELIGTIPNLPPEEAEISMREAHQVCPYSKATRGNIEVTLSVAE